MTSLDVCNPQIRNFDEAGIGLFVGILSNPTNHVGELSQSHPVPPTWQCCQFTIVQACRANLYVIWPSDCSACQGSAYGLGFENVDPACDMLQPRHAGVETGQVAFEDLKDAVLLF
jgi:hypothetical protein